MGFLIRPFLALFAWLSTKRRRTVPAVVATPDLVVRFAPAVAPLRIVIQPASKRASTDQYVADALAATSTVVPTHDVGVLGAAVPSTLADLDREESKPIQVIVDPPSQPVQRSRARTLRRLARGSVAPTIDLDDDEITNIVPGPFSGDTTEPNIFVH